MSAVRFEIQHGSAWKTRMAGDLDVSLRRLLLELAVFTIQYPHRLFVDGKLIATCEPVPGHPNAPKITRHDQTSGC